MKKRILIIEDEKYLSFLLTKSLIEEGFEVEEVTLGEAGLKKMKEQQFDLVLLDLLLPGIDGFKVLTEMKKDPKLTSLPVIIVSNLGQKDDIERAKNLGATEYFIKANVSLSEIVDKIKNILKPSL